jgi:ComF family protein
MKFPSIKDLRNGIVHLLYPDLCEGCSKPLISGEHVLCMGCATMLPETNYHYADNNETALRFAGRVPFEKATSLAYFTDDGLLQHLLHGLKYRGQIENGKYLGARLAAALKDGGWLNGIDAVMPVPLHASRQQERGYNQSAIIAKAMGLITDEVSLMRVRKTESQTTKTRAERADNMQGAFKLADNNNLSGKHILILDDVLTTGATIEACANVLQTAQNVKISIATIGIAIS